MNGKASTTTGFVADTVTTPGRAIALWWAQQLGAPTFKATDEHDSEQDRANMDMAAMMATLIVGPNDLTQEQAQAFTETLAKKVDADLAGGTHGVYLDVDYGPCPALAAAAEIAGIPISRFPWKTNTYTTRDYVTASLGYRSPTTLVWSAPGWERPTCESRRYTDDWSEQLPEVCGMPMFHEEPEHGSWIPRAVTR